MLALLVYSIIVVVAVEILGCHGYPYSMTYAELTSVSVSIPAEATSVDLRHNRITNLTSGIFSHLSVCTSILINSNQISIIEAGAFTGLQALTLLDLSHNCISRLEEYTFSLLTNLEELNLSFNHTSTISPESFRALTHLRILHLQHNYLTEIPTHALSTVPKLVELRLSYNLLRTLKSDVFNLDNRPYTMILYLSGNRLLCDSDLCWLKAAVESGSINHASNLTCGHQGDVSFQPIDWYCTSEMVTMTTEYQSSRSQVTTSPLQLETTGSGNQEDDGTSLLHLALGLVGGMLALIIVVVVSIYVVCRVKGFTLKKKEVEGPKRQALEAAAPEVQEPEIPLSEIPGSEVQAPQVQAPDVPGLEVPLPEVPGSEVQAPEVQAPGAPARSTEMECEHNPDHSGYLTPVNREPSYPIIKE